MSDPSSRRWPPLVVAFYDSLSGRFDYSVPRLEHSWCPMLLYLYRIVYHLLNSTNVVKELQVLYIDRK